ncbi:NAD(P)-binding domain-containing protein [Actinocatenispora thailandica]
MVTIVTDREVGQLPPRSAIAAMRAAVLAAHRGELVAPPRAALDLAGGRLMVTAGGTDRWYGHRAYLVGAPADQVVVLVEDGRLRAVAVGDLLGQYRVGALGAVAADALARPDAHRLGIIGTGAQAYAQAWAIRAVRDLTAVTVYGRDPDRRAGFARRLRDELGLPAVAATEPAAAVRDHDIVVLATNSTTPVLDPGWLSPGTAVTTLGPKQAGRSEFDLRLAEAAALITTDSVRQLDGYDPPFVLAGTAARAGMVGLGAVLTGERALPADPAAIRLYCSVGLAGTEPALLRAVLA